MPAMPDLNSLTSGGLQMKHKISGAVSLCFLAVCALAGQAAADEMSLAKCKAVFGSYVTSISDIEGVFQSRGLVTFSGDGVFLINDSGQGGVEARPEGQA